MWGIQSFLLQASIAAPTAADKHVLVKDNTKRTSNVYLNLSDSSLLEYSDISLKVQRYSIDFIGWEKGNPLFCVTFQDTKYSRMNKNFVWTLWGKQIYAI